MVASWLLVPFLIRNLRQSLLDLRIAPFGAFWRWYTVWVICLEAQWGLDRGAIVPINSRIPNHAAIPGPGF
jgi:hypothetical protein